ncbi:MAG: glycosyltransferase [Bacteroidetes bacterium]|nr:glycosyltransferase [Bacteroidota bacterium]
MKEGLDSNLPYISVIIPVYNDYENLFICLNALKEQDYPKNKTEIIVIDNLSDKIPEKIKEYNVVLLNEDKFKSSYAARNKGITISKGNVIAFIDSDCIPNSDWLCAGINCIIDKNADLVGGNIEFLIKKNSFFHTFDSRFHLQQEFNIGNNTGITANLFVNKLLFEKLGLFPEWISGGDSYWTNKAVNDGCKLVFSKQAVVKHPSRGFWGLLKKRKRTGIGFVQRLQFEGRSRFYILKKLVILSFIYPKKPIPKGLPKISGFFNYLFSHKMISYSALSGIYYLLFCSKRK